jgi:hypothetical protein
MPFGGVGDFHVTPVRGDLAVSKQIETGQEAPAVILS